MFGWGKKKAESSKPGSAAGSGSGAASGATDKQLHRTKSAQDSRLIKMEVPFEKAPDRIKPPPEKKLTDEQIAMYNTLLKYFSDPKLEIPVKENYHEDTPKRPLSPDEKAWVTRECILRYLRATKWVVKDAIKRLTGTLAWRREFGITSYTDDSKNIVNPDLVEPESLTGKEVVLGFDDCDRPCCYLKPGRQNTKTSFRQVQHLVFFLERTIDFMPPGQDSLALLIDFQQHPEIAANVQTSKIPPLSVGRQVLHILQTHYPERLGKAMLTNMPFLARTFMKLIYPFIDPLTKEKIAFESEFYEFVPREQLDKDFDGYVDFEYNHEVYWPALNKMASARRAQYIKQFEKFGGVVGLSEIDLRGENDTLKVPVGSHPWQSDEEKLTSTLSKLSLAKTPTANASITRATTHSSMKAPVVTATTASVSNNSRVINEQPVLVQD